MPLLGDVYRVANAGLVETVRRAVHGDPGPSIAAAMPTASAMGAPASPAVAATMPAPVARLAVEMATAAEPLGAALAGSATAPSPLTTTSHPLTQEEARTMTIEHDLLGRAREIAASRHDAVVAMAVNDMAQWWSLTEANGRADDARRAAAAHTPEAIEGAATAIYAASAAIRNEFPTVQSFTGYVTGTLAGRIRILSRH